MILHSARFGRVEFGNVFSAPGALGFFMEGYPFHRLWRYLGLDYRGTTFISKTATWYPRDGNMPLKPGSLKPKELFPKCIIVDLPSGHVLNACSFNNPGIERLLEMGRWQNLQEPFVINISSASPTSEERLWEIKQIVRSISDHLDEFRAPFAIMPTFGCPNVALDSLDEDEPYHWVGIIKDLGAPVILNFSPTAPTGMIVKAVRHSFSKALCIINTVPWGTEGIDCQKIFGSQQSPLEMRGFSSGGISGPACLPLVLRKIEELRHEFRDFPIMGGNGIQSVDALKQLWWAGANAVSIGIVGMVRPKRLQSIIQAANTIFPKDSDCTMQY